MTTSTPSAVLQQLHWRYATKRFDPTRQIPAEAWAALEQSLVLAPSSFGLQPWKFVVVDTQALRQQLRTASWNQSQVTDAARYVVLTGLRTTTIADVDRYLQQQCEVRGTTMESLAGYRSMIADFVAKGWASKDLAGWNARQVYIALGQFMASAALLGVDTCPMEGIDAAAYDRILGLEGTPYAALCGCAAGYRAADDKYAAAPKVRFPAAQLIEHR
jgi:nitroreductase